MSERLTGKQRLLTSDKTGLSEGSRGCHNRRKTSPAKGFSGEGRGGMAAAPPVGSAVRSGPAPPGAGQILPGTAKFDPQRSFTYGPSSSGFRREVDIPCGDQRTGGYASISVISLPWRRSRKQTCPSGCPIAEFVGKEMLGAGLFRNGAHWAAVPVRFTSLSMMARSSSAGSSWPGGRAYSGPSPDARG